jgi:hypothetical protein
LSALLLLAAGARMLPSMQGKVDAFDEGGAPTASSTQENSRPKRERTVKPTPAPSEPADAKTQALIQKVVSGQLTAFARDDFSRAMAYSSPEFRKMYTPDSFRQMVKTVYAGLITDNAPRFAPARCYGQTATIPVLLSGEDGSEVIYTYILRRSSMPVPSNPASAGSSTDKSPKSLTRDGVVWYIEGVSPPGMAGYSQTDAPNSARITDIREL